MSWQALFPDPRFRSPTTIPRYFHDCTICKERFEVDVGTRVSIYMTIVGSDGQKVQLEARLCQKCSPVIADMLLERGLVEEVKPKL